MNARSKGALRLGTVLIILCLLPAVLCGAADIERGKYSYSKASESGYAATTFHSLYQSGENSLNKASSLPSSYSSVSKNLVTEIKDQGNYGTCWAFAAMSIAETSAINEFSSYSSTNTDFSEAHHAYFTLMGKKDEMGLTSGDRCEIRGSNFLDLGGNLYFSTMSLAKWFGVVDESAAPYSKVSPSKTYSASLAYSKNKLILENALWIPMKNTEQVKKSIMKYGSCAVAYYHDEMNFNTANGAYYQSLYSTSNHNVAIVGWNDKYPRENFGTFFNLFSRPRKNGAWLVKTSFGSDYGNDGYLWISYEDTSLFQDDAVFFDLAPADEYDNNYQYDGTVCAMSYYSYDDKIYAANVFESSGTEVLKAFSFYTNDENVTCYYQVYKNVGSSSPVGKTKVFSSAVKSVQHHAGYHTVELKHPVQLKKGETFSIVLRFEKKGSKVYALSDYVGEFDMSGQLYAYGKNKRGQSYVSVNGKKWTDLYTYNDGDNLRIKAFTSDGVIRPEKLSVKADSEIALGQSVKATVSLKPTYSNGDVTWKSSNSAVATVSSSGKITAKSCGTVKITCKSKHSSASSSITVKVVPKSIEGAKVSKQMQTYLVLEWNSGNYDGVKIYRKSADSSKYVLLGKVEGKTQYKVTSLTSGSSDKYKLICYKTVSGKDYNSKGVVIYGTTRPKNVEGLKITKKTKTTVQIKWNKLSHADMYRVYVYDKKKNAYVKQADVKSSSYTFKNLSAKKTYRVAVRAICKQDGKNIFSSSFTEIRIKAAG